MAIWIFVFTAISALTGIITCLPVLGADLRILGRKEMREKDKESLPLKEISKGRYWLLLVVSGVAFILSISGIVMHEMSPSFPSAKEWRIKRNVLENQPIGEIFDNETIELDGKRFENSTFFYPTFIIRGKEPFIFANNHVTMPVTIEVVDGPQATAADMVMSIIVEKCRDHLESCDVRGIRFKVVNEKLKEVTQPF